MYVAFYGTLTTVLLVGFGFFSYRNARADAEKTARDWVEKEGTSKLEAIVQKLEVEAQEKIAEAVNTAKIEIEQKSKVEELFIEGNSHYWNKEYDKAIEAYKRVIEINPKYDAAYFNMGNAYVKKEMYDEAIEAYKKAIEINSKNHDAYTNLFELQLITNQEFESEQTYKTNFENDKKAFVKYEMLKILQAIYRGEKYGLSPQEWSEKYRGVSLGGWSWHELDRWIDGISEGDIKASLSEATAVFKAHK